SSLPRGAFFGGMAALLKAEPKRLEPYLGRKPEGAQAFAALNAALFSDGAVLILPKGVELDKPVHLLFLSSVSGRATQAHVRLLIAAEAGAKAALIEEYASLG